MRKRKKKTVSALSDDEREVEAELEKYYKAMKTAIIINPELRALFEEVKKKQRVVTCTELKGMLEKTRMLLDNVEWEDEPEWNLVNHIFFSLLNQFKKRCRKMWIEYTDELAPKYVHRMQEALLWDKVKPRKLNE